MRDNAVAGRMPYGWEPIRIAGTAPPAMTYRLKNSRVCVDGPSA